MKKLLLIFFILFACEKETVPIFQKYGEFGTNILHENYFNFDGSYRTDKTFYSIATDRPIRIIIKSIEGIWYISYCGEWDVSKFENGSQTFESTESADRMIFFKDSGSAIIEYYENDKLILSKDIYWDYFVF